MLTVRLPDELEQRLDQLAHVTCRTKSFYVKEAIERYLEDMEDIYMSKHRVAEPSAKYYTSEEVKDKLDKDET